ncbi:MAG: signal peptide peptidase SppA [Deltaproteobacteria bacterium]|nr:MAG: S49 family peptidase [Desulfobacteraceae bacterium 4484_190.3]RLB15201.1 MAG: signal peptide peptidase SppA [Deltaproteobacteria bacterium]
MAKKKHPIFTVLLIIAVFALLLGTVAVLVVKFVSPTSHISFTQKIGVVPINGTIVNAQPVISQIIRFRKDKSIKAIIVRIDSPGGGVGPSQEIYEELKRTRKKKKVIASMGSVAASGGFYVASAADRIVANPGTITGSIGVIMEFVQFKSLLEKIGINLEVIKSGEYKDVGYPQRELTDRDRKILGHVIKDIQGQFVSAVAEGRHLSKEKVEAIADGRIFSGERAKELGLVDRLGNFQDAVELAKKMTGLRGDVELVYPKRHGARFWDLLFDSASRSLLKWLQKTHARVEYTWQGGLNPVLR